MSHTITSEIEIKFFSSPEVQDVAYPELEITYDFTKGTPARINYDENDHPAESAEIEVTDVKLLHGDGLEPTKEQLFAWAEAWINDAGFYKASENAVDDDEGDRADYEYERRRDRDAGI